MRLEPMTRAHLEPMAELERLCFSCPWSLSMLAGELENPYARYRLAMEDDKLLGYAGMYAVSGQGFITNVAVSPEMRRRGIAAALLRDMIDYAKKEELSELMLEVRVSNAAAIALYEKFGFFTAGRRPRYYEHPVEDALLMNLRLT